MTTLEPGYNCEGGLVNPEITPMAVKQRPLEEGCGILSPDFGIPVEIRQKMILFSIGYNTLSYK